MLGMEGTDLLLRLMGKPGGQVEPHGDTSMIAEIQKQRTVQIIEQKSQKRESRIRSRKKQ